MLHVITKVGKMGRKEKQRRHFPGIHNLPSESVYLPRGHKYIAHNYGTDLDWVPHGRYIEPQLSESGPDWSSRCRYIPDPENPEYPAAEIWPNNWRSMRSYPLNYALSEKNSLEFDDFDGDISNNNNKSTENNRSVSERQSSFVPALQQTIERLKGTYQRSDKEWLLDPALIKLGRRCIFNGVHKASETRENELTHTMLYGKGRPECLMDKRNKLPEASPGDKSYQVPEYSQSFHKLGSTRALIKYGPAKSLRTPDTFIPLVPLPSTPREPFREKEKKRQLQNDIEDVRTLNVWRPATPLPMTLPSLDEYKK